MRRQRIEWLLELARRFLFRLLEGQTREVVIVSVFVPLILLLLWLRIRAIRRDAEAERRAAEAERNWRPPSTEEVARVIHPSGVEAARSVVADPAIPPGEGPSSP